MGSVTTPEHETVAFDRGGNDSSDATLTGAAMEEVCRRYDPVVRRYLRASGVGGASIDDCAQEVWLRALQNASSYDPRRGAITTWLYGIVRNVVRQRSAADHRQRTQRLPSNDLLSEVGAEDSRRDENDRLRQALAKALNELRQDMSPTNRRLIQMRWLRRRGVDEVASTLRMSRQQVWTREHRLRVKGRKLLVRLLRQEW